MKKYVEWNDLTLDEQHVYIERALYLIDSGYLLSDNERILAKSIYESKFSRNDKGESN